MKYLIDTHVWLWAIAQARRVSDSVRRKLDGGLCHLSVVSLWEVQIKSATGKLALPEALEILVERSKVDWVLLPLREQHVFALGSLPQLHKDPFDRMLVAQAKADGLTLVTADETLIGYGVPTLDARA